MHDVHSEVARCSTSVARNNGTSTARNESKVRTWPNQRGCQYVLTLSEVLLQAARPTAGDLADGSTLASRAVDVEHDLLAGAARALAEVADLAAVGDDAVPHAGLAVHGDLGQRVNRTVLTSRGRADLQSAVAQRPAGSGDERARSVIGAMPHAPSAGHTAHACARTRGCRSRPSPAQRRSCSRWWT